jgi:hypothetical protein
MTLVDSSEELMAPPSPSPSRKVMQIVAGSETHPVYALCADDSIWYFTRATLTWSRIPDVPSADVIETPYDSSTPPDVP